MNENKQPFEQYTVTNQSGLEAIDTSSFVDGYTYACTVLAHNNQPAAQMLWNYSLDIDASPEDGIIKPTNVLSGDPGRWVFGWWIGASLGGDVDSVTGQDNIIIDSSDQYNPIVKANLTKYPFSPQSTAPTPAEGQLYYDANKNNLVTQAVSGSSLELDLGREVRVRAKNETGSLIEKGKVVYVFGGAVETSTDIVSIAKAQADSKVKCTFVGVTLQDISDGSVGEIAMSGIARGVDTTAFTVGDRVYISEDTAGDLVNIAPEYPFYECKVGIVLESSSSGSIYLAPDADPGQGSGGVSATGVNTYDVALIDDQFLMPTQNGQGGYLSTIVVPTENITIYKLSIYITQLGSFAQGGLSSVQGFRLGIYSIGTSGDTLISSSAQTARQTSWSLGINEIALLGGVSLSANTRYMFAIQTRNIQDMKVGYKVESLANQDNNAPNHMGRYGNAGSADMDTTMDTFASYTQTDKRLWIAGTSAN